MDRRILALTLLMVLSACDGGSPQSQDIDADALDANTEDTDSPDADGDETDTIDSDVDDESDHDDGDIELEEVSPYGLDCPLPTTSSLPDESPRILILGPADDPSEIAEHLQGILSADTALESPVVAAQSIEAGISGEGIGGGTTSMNFFYLPDDRDERLALLAEPWSYVVILENNHTTLWNPEFFFEGVRTIGCNARAMGAKPVVLMNLTAEWNLEEQGEVTYRVANGTDSIVAPAGYAWQEALTTAKADYARDRLFVVAATIYSTLMGRDAGATSYRPTETPPDLATQLATIAADTVLAEAERVHYEGPYDGYIKMGTAPPGGDFWFMYSGTSSEQIWADRMNEILPRAGLTPQGTGIGHTNPSKTFDAAGLDNAMPYFDDHQYQILFARGYEIDAETIRTTGSQPNLQVEIWDRHLDATLSDGILALQVLEIRSETVYSRAKAIDLEMIPYHLMFARLKTAQPSHQLLSDGVHATYPVGYGLATMSIVSRTGLHPSTDGLDSDTLLAARIGEETIRQLSTLSITGEHIPDDPASRPIP